jgi:hypothetical protein
MVAGAAEVNEWKLAVSWTVGHDTRLWNDVSRWPRLENEKWVRYGTMRYGNG